MSKTLLLLRHGQTTSNVSGRYMGRVDEELSDEGIWQASRLAERLRQWPIEEVYSSPLRRALSTAEAVALPHALSTKKDEDLTEIDIGDWQGMFASEIAANYPDLWKAWRIDPSGFEAPGGESLLAVRRRVTSALERIVSATEGQMVALVTHEVVVRLLVAHCLVVSTSVYRRLEVANASLTIVQNRGDSWQLRLLNDTAHLGDKAYTGASH
jgi:broad specificity phosphatase PhoE